MPEPLSCHPDFAADSVTGIGVTVEYQPTGKLLLQYKVLGLVNQLVMPERLPPERSDDLWQQTCFEAFIGASDDPAYLELNFSPSTQWAAYGFSSYREGMSDLEIVTPPDIGISHTSDSFELLAEVNLSGLPMIDAGCLELALTAVVAEKNGRKSFWALKHPDFHNRDCFLHKVKMAKSR